jgi:hypothetical protein
MLEEKALASPEQILTRLIEENLEDLAESWLRIVRNHTITRSYGVFDQEELRRRVITVYNQLGLWLGGTFTKGDISSYFTALGAQRRREGFRLAEVVRALIASRRVLWFKVRDTGLLDRALDPDMALLLTNRVILFFDRAMYFTVYGYEMK